MNHRRRDTECQEIPMRKALFLSAALVGLTVGALWSVSAEAG